MILRVPRNYISALDKARKLKFNSDVHDFNNWKALPLIQVKGLQSQSYC